MENGTTHTKYTQAGHKLSMHTVRVPGPTVCFVVANPPLPVASRGSLVSSWYTAHIEEEKNVRIDRSGQCKANIKYKDETNTLVV